MIENSGKALVKGFVRKHKEIEELKKLIESLTSKITSLEEDNKILKREKGS